MQNEKINIFLGQICFLQEFGCNTNTYDPYEKGPVPQFRSEKALWF